MLTKTPITQNAGAFYRDIPKNPKFFMLKNGLYIRQTL